MDVYMKTVLWVSCHGMLNKDYSMPSSISTCKYSYTRPHTTANRIHTYMYRSTCHLHLAQKFNLTWNIYFTVGLSRLWILRHVKHVYEQVSTRVQWTIPLPLWNAHIYLKTSTFKHLIFSLILICKKYV